MMPNRFQPPGASHGASHAGSGGAVTVRELIQASPATVTADWCRQVAAHLLDDIDCREPTRPHRIIMPDSVLVDGAGTAELLASPEDDAEFQPPVSVDLKAIAAVLHFAISGESPPGGPLLLRVLPAFDEQLRGAIDACLYGDRTQRPQNVAAMRALLGLPVSANTAAPVRQAAPAPAPPAAPAPVAVPPAMAASTAAPLVADAAPVLAVDVPFVAPVTAPSPAPPAAPVMPAVMAPVAEPATGPASSAAGAQPVAARPLRTTRLLLGCLTLVALGFGGYALYQRGRQAGAEAVLAATATASPPAPAVVPAAPTLPVPATGASAASGSMENAPANDTATAPADAVIAVSPPAPPQAAAPAAAQAAAALPPAPPAPRAVAATTIYQLRIKPWGTVYVDGVKRGISPPMKSLSLTGEHTVRIDNPGFPSRQFTVRPGKDANSRIEHDFD